MHRQKWACGFSVKSFTHFQLEPLANDFSHQEDTPAGRHSRPQQAHVHCKRTRCHSFSLLQRPASEPPYRVAGMTSSLFPAMKLALLSAPFWAGLARKQGPACLPIGLKRFPSSAIRSTEYRQVQIPLKFFPEISKLRKGTRGSHSHTKL